MKNDNNEENNIKYRNNKSFIYYMKQRAYRM